MQHGIMAPSQIQGNIAESKFRPTMGSNQCRKHVMFDDNLSVNTMRLESIPGAVQCGVVQCGGQYKPGGE